MTIVSLMAVLRCANIVALEKAGPGCLYKFSFHLVQFPDLSYCKNNFLNTKGRLGSKQLGTQEAFRPFGGFFGG